MTVFEVKQITLDWLLENNNPPVRYHTLTKILDKAESENDVVKTKEIINTYYPISEILKNQKEGTYWFDKAGDKNYKKYLGTFWQLHFLNLMHTQKTKGIENAFNHIFSTGQAPNGGFSVTGTDVGSAVCLTANIVRTLIHFGYLNDEHTRKALEYLIEKFIRTDGIVHCGDTGSLITSCFMTIPKVLFSFAQIPEKQRSSEIKKGITTCTRILLENQIFKYIPEKNKEWFNYAAARNLKGKQMIEERNKYLEKNPVKTKIAKASWVKFGFPLSYTSDTLDVLHALAIAKINYSKELDASLELVKTKCINGRWVNEKQFKSDMYVEIEPYQKESKWLTLHALFVLKHFLGLKIL